MIKEEYFGAIYIKAKYAPDNGEKSAPAAFLSRAGAMQNAADAGKYKTGICARSDIYG